MFALTTAAFSQECFQVLSGTRIQRELNGTYTLIINYSTTGNKALEVLVKCDNNVIKTDCFINNGNGVQTYPMLTCNSGNISAILTPHEGSCNSRSCTPQTFFGPAGAGF